MLKALTDFSDFLFPEPSREIDHGNRIQVQPPEDDVANQIHEDQNQHDEDNQNRQRMCQHQRTNHKYSSQAEANAASHLSYNDPELIEENVGLARECLAVFG